MRNFLGVQKHPKLGEAKKRGHSNKMFRYFFFSGKSRKHIPETNQSAASKNRRSRNKNKKKHVFKTEYHKTQKKTTLKRSCFLKHPFFGFAPHHPSPRKQHWEQVLTPPVALVSLVKMERSSTKMLATSTWSVFLLLKMSLTVTVLVIWSELDKT